MSVGESNPVPSDAELSSGEFGYDEMEEKFALHLSDDLEPVALKDWTAKDFANIYVRFRPHLESHARKYLKNPSQVEEVVQDAFLYLMTSLPELDSELGVLRFLKWKTKMLALDVIRASAKAPVTVESDFLEQTGGADERELSDALERADDAAIVNMAFAKLSVRHREALVAAVYEEKSHEQVAQEMGLSENAFRQLLFRARSAFKKALIGEAETAGLSASQILSIAARKAASGSGKYIGAAGVLLLVLSLTIPGQVRVWTDSPAPISAAIQEPGESPRPPAEELAPESTAPQISSDLAQAAPESEAVSVAVSADQTPSLVPPALQSGADEPVQSAIVAEEAVDTAVDLASLFEPALRTSAEWAGFYLGNNRASTFNFYQNQNIEIFGGQGLSVFAHLDTSNLTFDSAVIELVSGDTRLFGVPRKASVEFLNSGNEQSMLATFYDFIPVDSQENVLGQDIFAGKIAQVSLEFNSDFSIISASLFVLSVN